MAKSEKSDSKKMIVGKKADWEFDPISAALRQMHDGVANEPVPDDFLKLLDQLEERIAASEDKNR